MTKLFLTPLFLMFISWLEAHLLACPFKSHTGIDCPGCGLQRAILSLMQGDVADSFKLYPAAIPMVALALFVPAHIKFDFKHGAVLIKWLYAGIAILIILNYIYKIYTHKLV